MDHQFRSVAFGGFHKQDVLNFLETSSQNHAQQLQELHKQLEEQIAQTEKAQAEADALLGRAEKAEGELQQLREQVQQLSDSLNSTREEREELAVQLEQARERAERLEPDATAYTALKDRAAGVELDAHRRAQEVEDRAAGEVLRMREDVRLWMKELEREYDRLRTDTQATVAHARAQLDRAGQALDQVGLLMEQQAGRLEQMEQMCAQQTQTEGKTQA